MHRSKSPGLLLCQDPDFKNSLLGRLLPADFLFAGKSGKFLNEPLFVRGLWNDPFYNNKRSSLHLMGA